ncbi:hypothetical protein ANCDUO_07128 [Ancylostoma duodenale]|uniref:Uncharacterized protein n=1 Tax=Ancylostoma duodenale TaxID=51022 RepID=A0A0C2DJA5_9BILA|nr:hypothetical protein ANCDUO_07128 [Ancylostoma duodenale]
MELNSSCSRLATIDSSNLLQFFEVSEKDVSKISGMDVREVADLKWDESLRDAKQLLERLKIEEAVEFIGRNPHPRLWRVFSSELPILK